MAKITECSGSGSNTRMLPLHTRVSRVCADTTRAAGKKQSMTAAVPGGAANFPSMKTRDFPYCAFDGPDAVKSFGTLRAGEKYIADKPYLTLFQRSYRECCGTICWVPVPTTRRTHHLTRIDAQGHVHLVVCEAGIPVEAKQVV